MNLEGAIEKECSQYSEKELLRAAEDLTTRYHSQRAHDTHLHRVAYLATRLPATYAVLKKVFSEIEVPERVIDCGAGPGTSLWALPESSITLIEQDGEFVKLGKRLAPREAMWKTQSFLSLTDRADLILFSYSLNEIPPEKVSLAIEKAYAQTDNFIVVIEPGTPEGFERIRAIRKQLLGLGMSIHAPCPHHETCPMVGSNWCHFSVRLPRTSLHRKLKKGSLGYEDEKYSYLIASKEPHSPSGARILRHPLKRKGHSVATLCTKEGLIEKTFTGKERKDLSWGDLLD
ncbi:small ribosomal subunit Rsm22 family protein [Candidatus Neptunochlamydia vexilliferae]|uniref:rRNA methyltransferase n=1 Tax=Candidatus Neptunichlamydia vexilliferae TaxID=1651774 RepID=A0ABS0AYQ2_9BACT|nr:small ribosomal subunit Rsm22 family protein [Candidatus Neptunochlamydia vexilliferae]MBF5059264.1 hypothetical protein [Candidatus Neptunochlamydia vexilliferae]